jgi:hypothetical protein
VKHACVLLVSVASVALIQSAALARPQVTTQTVVQNAAVVFEARVVRVEAGTMPRDTGYFSGMKASLVTLEVLKRWKGDLKSPVKVYVLDEKEQPCTTPTRPTVGNEYLLLPNVMGATMEANRCMNTLFALDETATVEAYRTALKNLMPAP